ncbi:hypothetical protein ACGFZL_22510 [Streptomyces sp. NPDC048182]|uniref:hypothetical protein n=1 Tax=Streptomyces sp. NPDC048182 TaxID=3365507 RepID=UPI00371471C6
MTLTANSPAPPGPLLRGATTGCLVLLLLPACLLVWFWYTVWHNGHLNREAKESAEASVVLRARQESDAARGTLTATGSWSATYTEKGVVLSGGPIEVDRCFTLTARRSGTTWTTRPAGGTREACEASRVIRDRVDLALVSLRNTPTERLTRAQVARALDPTGRQHRYDVRQAVRDEHAVRVTVLVRDAVAQAPTAQCYQFTRLLDPPAGAESTSAVPLASC